MWLQDWKEEEPSILSGKIINTGSETCGLRRRTYYGVVSSKGPTPQEHYALWCGKVWETLDFTHPEAAWASVGEGLKSWMQVRPRIQGNAHSVNPLTLQPCDVCNASVTRWTLEPKFLRPILRNFPELSHLKVKMITALLVEFFGMIEWANIWKVMLQLLLLLITMWMKLMVSSSRDAYSKKSTILPFYACIGDIMEKNKFQIYLRSKLIHLITKRGTEVDLIISYMCERIF